MRYSDTRQLYADLVAGKVDLSFNNLMSLLPLIRQDKLVALGTTDAKPHPALALAVDRQRRHLDYALTNWLGIVGPARLDRTLIADIEAALKHAVQSSATDTKGPEIVPSTAAEFQTHLEREWQFWPPVVRDLNLQTSE